MSVVDQTMVRLLPLIPKAIVARVASRYVAGETIAEAIATVRELGTIGAAATLDILGEHLTDQAETESVTRDYIAVLEAIAQAEADAGVSIKPSHLGLDIGEELCLQNMSHIAEAARERDRFVRIDMESHEATDASLRLYEKLQARYGNVGIVLQAYMIRTPRDIDRVGRVAGGGNVRLCKGIYVEPRTIAWQDFDTVRANFVHAAEKLLRQGIFAAIATHDPYLVWACMALIDKYDVPKDRYEFQTLLGVDVELEQMILREGHKLRVYVPFGEQWYEYSIRRLRENPKIARNVVRAFFGLR